jgi:hypothetical protein
VVPDSEADQTRKGVRIVLEMLFISSLALLTAGRDPGQDWHFRHGGKKISRTKALRLAGADDLLGEELSWEQARITAREHNHGVLEDLGLTSHHLLRYARELGARGTEVDRTR